MVNNYKKYFWGLIILIMSMVFGAINVFAADSTYGISYVASYHAVNDTTINVQCVEKQYYLFLPSSANLKELELQFDGGEAMIKSASQSKTIYSGESFNLVEMFPKGATNGKYTVTFSNGGTPIKINIMKSANIGSMYIKTSNPAKDLNWINKEKENKAKNNPMVMLKADGTCIYDGTLKNIRGRGNSTWDYKKKPYQIKLENKTDLLETGNQGEAQDTWILLANYIDPTIIKNSITYDLAAEFGLKYSPHSEMIDLYYDGSYLGTYLLSEKTEVGTGRVEVEDLDESIEAANPDIQNFDDLKTEIGYNGNIKYQYVSGLMSPEVITGGYLLEMDYIQRLYEEKSWFISENNNNMVCKSPEYATSDAMEYISSIWKNFEDAVYNGGVNPDTGKFFDEYVDLESLAKYYLILELSMECDAFQSSTYFYKSVNEDKLYAGPAWDFDTSYKGDALFKGADMGSLVAGRSGFGRTLLSIPKFRQEIKKYYKEELNDIVKNILLSKNGKCSESLDSIYGYGEKYADSQLMNANLWSLSTTSNAKYNEKLDELYNTILKRNERLYEQIMDWDENTEIYRGFFDVPDTEWYHDAVIKSVDLGLFKGISNFIFEPGNNCSRAMVVSVLYRMAGQPKVEEKTSFTDIKESNWYYDAAIWASQNNIANGYKNKFNGGEPVTREQMITMMNRYYCYISNTPAASTYSQSDLNYIKKKYSDYKNVSNFAVSSLKWASENGLIMGDHKSRLWPLKNTTRAEAAAIFMRYVENIEKN